MSNTRLGGIIGTLSPRDSLSPLASMGNPHRAGGGYAKSPLAGALIGKGQLNNLNLAKNDLVDPTGEVLDAQDARVIALAPDSALAITVAELVAIDPVSTDTSTAGDSAGASSDGAASGPAGGGGVGGTGDGPTGGDAF